MKNRQIKNFSALLNTQLIVKNIRKIVLHIKIPLEPPYCQLFKTGLKIENDDLKEKIQYSSYP